MSYHSAPGFRSSSLRARSIAMVMALTFFSLCAIPAMAQPPSDAPLTEGIGSYDDGIRLLCEVEVLALEMAYGAGSGEAMPVRLSYVEEKGEPRPVFDGFDAFVGGSCEFVMRDDLTSGGSGDETGQGWWSGDKWDGVGTPPSQFLCRTAHLDFPGGTPLYQHEESSCGGEVLVLENGANLEQVLEGLGDLGPYPGQLNIRSILVDFLVGDLISLDEGERLLLFELGDATPAPEGPGEARDFQDAVFKVRTWHGYPRHLDQEDRVGAGGTDLLGLAGLDAFHQATGDSWSLPASLFTANHCGTLGRLTVVATARDTASGAELSPEDWAGFSYRVSYWSSPENFFLNPGAPDHELPLTAPANQDWITPVGYQTVSGGEPWGPHSVERPAQHRLTFDLAYWKIPLENGQTFVLGITAEHDGTGRLAVCFSGADGSGQADVIYWRTSPDPPEEPEYLDDAGAAAHRLAMKVNIQQCVEGYEEWIFDNIRHHDGDPARPDQVVTHLTYGYLSMNDSNSGLSEYLLTLARFVPENDMSITDIRWLTSFFGPGGSVIAPFDFYDIDQGFGFRFYLYDSWQAVLDEKHNPQVGKFCFAMEDVKQVNGHWGLDPENLDPFNELFLGTGAPTLDNYLLTFDKDGSSCNTEVILQGGKEYVISGLIDVSYLGDGGSLSPSSWFNPDETSDYQFFYGSGPYEYHNLAEMSPFSNTRFGYALRGEVTRCCGRDGYVCEPEDLGEFPTPPLTSGADEARPNTGDTMRSSAGPSESGVNGETPSEADADGENPSSSGTSNVSNPGPQVPPGPFGLASGVFPFVP